MKEAVEEIRIGDRFEFGENWRKFLQWLNEERLVQAETSLKNALEMQSLEGKTFLDVGSGSGLFSLAARRLGAKVHSVDLDPQSVACTNELKRRYFPGDPMWVVEEGNILDMSYVRRLGTFDIVYSWGVLHHTGAMWEALQNVDALVSDRGRLYIAIYNDLGPSSARWKKVKKAYNRLPKRLRFLILWPSFLYMWFPVMVIDIFRGTPFRTWKNYSSVNRGMSPWRDMVDWVGGYPFEVAKPEEIFEFHKRNGYVLDHLTTRLSGCNEFVFTKNDSR
ncbi:MAG: class I SAM-dependent methyltransferase [Deltaproteobacteria bacterium]|nr:class I SAM-dependent methyltransferase [Deltaproteobacteria bacterium]